MQKYIFILVLFLAVKQVSAQQPQHKDSLKIQVKDSSKTDEVFEDAIIENIIDTKKAPQKDKVQYISQLTKYGFKNLFNKYRYNASLPYSSQVNPNAENYMQDYLRSHTNGLEKMKNWGMPYFNLIDNIFMQYGLPKELKYLAVIESNLQTNATSWVGAGGPWQFMPYTAREYGLVVNGSFDERRDYQKSTHAAARYLLSLYKDLNDWLLVIAAYNGGPGRVYSAIRKSGSKDFWSLQYYLPEESRNHVKKFIATHYVMEGNGDFTSGGPSEMTRTAYNGTSGN
ncbi:MAG: lytic transglycosylase domain-containing protein, partial [Ferruginibacter sp.]